MCHMYHNHMYTWCTPILVLNTNYHSLFSFRDGIQNYLNLSTDILAFTDPLLTHYHKKLVHMLLIYDCSLVSVYR